MAHDKNGSELQQGDRVMMTGKIVEAATSDSACNVTIQIDSPEGEVVALVSANGRSCAKVDGQQ